jgi:hypothetical protein
MMWFCSYTVEIIRNIQLPKLHVEASIPFARSNLAIRVWRVSA